VWPGVSVIVLASVAIATFGCSHDTLGSGTQDLSVVYTPKPPGAGRYDSATFEITRIQALPVDPGTAAIFGAETLLFRFDRFTADLTATTAVAYSQIALAAGPYQVTLIEFTPPALLDNQGSTPLTCAEYFQKVDRLNSGSAPGVPSLFKFPDPAFPNEPANPTFTVRPGQTVLSAAVNVPGLIAGYENSFTCVDGPPPRLTAFSTAKFRAALLANITFQ
jgi:hypothetical protein